MSQSFTSDDEILDYVRSLGGAAVEEKRLRDICRFSYNTPEAKDAACGALTEFLRSRSGFYVGYLAEIAEFLESCDYAPARQALLKHRNALKPDIDRGDHGIMVLSREAKKAWAAVNHAVDHLAGLPVLTPDGSASDVPASHSNIHVFVSYSSEDTQDAQAIGDRLKARGLRAYLACKDLRGGDDFGESIREALSVSLELWVLLTPTSIKSEWVLTEWGAAWVLGKRIVPLLLRVNHAALPDRLRRLQCVDYHGVDELIDELDERTRALGGRRLTSE